MTFHFASDPETGRLILVAGLQEARARLQAAGDGYLKARGKHRLFLPVRLPGKAARAVRGGANLAPERAVGHRTWADFLAERVPTKP